MISMLCCICVLLAWMRCEHSTRESTSSGATTSIFNAPHRHSCLPSLLHFHSCLPSLKTPICTPLKVPLAASSLLSLHSRLPSSLLALFTHDVTQPQNATVNPCPAVPTWCLIRAGAVCQSTLFGVRIFVYKRQDFTMCCPCDVAASIDA